MPLTHLFYVVCVCVLRENSEVTYSGGNVNKVNFSVKYE